MRFESGALGEVRRWVMSYGRHAPGVPAPARLRNDVAAELSAALKLYGNS